MKLKVVESTGVTRPKPMVPMMKAAAPATQITAVYKGDRLMYDQAMQATVDGVDYQWIIMREMPVMTFSADESDEDDGDGADSEIGIATWVPEGDTIIVPGEGGETSSTKSTVVSPRVNDETWPDESKTVTLGEMAMNALEQEVEAEQSEKGLAVSQRLDPNDPYGTGENRLRGRGGYTVDRGVIVRAVLMSAAKVAAGYVLRRAVRYAWNRRQARLAKLAAAKQTKAKKAPKVKVKKPHAPGWPASNFRRGKGAKRSKKAVEPTAAPTNGQPSFMDFSVKAGYTAPFEMSDGSTKLMQSAALSVVLLNSDGLVVWETGDIHVPDGSTAGLLVPAEIHIQGAIVTLLAEAQAYVEFLAAEPDLTVTVEAPVEQS